MLEYADKYGVHVGVSLLVLLFTAQWLVLRGIRSRLGRIERRLQQLQKQQLQQAQARKSEEPGGGGNPNGTRGASGLPPAFSRSHVTEEERQAGLDILEAHPGLSPFGEPYEGLLLLGTVREWLVLSKQGMQIGDFCREYEEEYFHWRLQNRADAIAQDALPERLRRFQVNSSVYGYTTAGLPVVVERAVSWEGAINSCLENGIPPKDFLQIRIYSCECYVRAIADQHANGKGNGQSVLVYDASGMAYGAWEARRALPYVKAAIADSSLRYVGCTRKIFIINTPWIFRFVWPFVQAMLPQLTKDKIVVVGNVPARFQDYQGDQFSTLTAASLPARLGGSIPDDKPLVPLYQPGVALPGSH
jgi:hypothetical protein